MALHGASHSSERMVPPNSNGMLSTSLTLYNLQLHVSFDIIEFEFISYFKWILGANIILLQQTKAQKTIFLSTVFRPISLVFPRDSLFYNKYLLRHAAPHQNHLSICKIKAPSSTNKKNFAPTHNYALQQAKIASFNIYYTFQPVTFCHISIHINVTIRSLLFQFFVKYV